MFIHYPLIAMLSAMMLRLQGHRPLVLDLTTTKSDYDHVVAIFRKHGAWGGISWVEREDEKRYTHFINISYEKAIYYWRKSV